jgi:small multidrug resistance family-3 protein
MTFVTWLIFTVAALLEVGGDAAIRRGLRGGGLLFILAGFIVLGSYGLVVNTVKWDFSKLLGVYVAVFAIISVLCGRYLFKETIPTSTWIGLGVIVVGGLIIQFGSVIPNNG